MSASRYIPGILRAARLGPAKHTKHPFVSYCYVTWASSRDSSECVAEFLIVDYLIFVDIWLRTSADLKLLTNIFIYIWNIYVNGRAHMACAAFLP